MDNQSNVKFSITVPFNNEDLIQLRNECAKGISTARYVFVSLFIIAAVSVLISFYDNMEWSLLFLFLGGAFSFLAAAKITLVLFKKYNESDNESFRYDFYENKVKIFKITKNEKKKTIKTIPIYNCSYKWSFFGQYILKITENATNISMMIYVGTRKDCGAIRDTVIIPKSLLADEIKRELIEFLKQKVGSHYVVKIK